MGANDDSDFIVHDDEGTLRKPSPSGANAAKGKGSLITVQPVRRTDMQPDYAQEFDDEDIKDHGFYGTFMHGLGEFIGCFGQIPCCICCPNPYNTVPTGSVGLVTRFQKAVRAVNSGLVKVNVCTEGLRVANVQVQVSALPKQQALSRDNVNVEIVSVLYYKITNPYKAIFGVADVRQALNELAQTTLRQIVGSRNLQSIITDREAVAAEVQEIVETTSESWGVTCDSILIKDIILSPETQDLLASAATQRRLGESRILAAKSEVEAAKLMRQAADCLSSPAAMQIRQLEALQHMAKSSGSRVIFVPMSLEGMGASIFNKNDAAQITPSPPVGEAAGGSRGQNINYSMQEVAGINALAHS